MLLLNNLLILGLTMLQCSLSLQMNLQWQGSGPGREDECSISSNLLVPPPSTQVFNFSIVSCTFEVNDNHSDNHELEIRDLNLSWSIPDEPNAEITDLHFQVYFGLNSIPKSAQNLYEIVNVSSSVSKVRCCIHVLYNHITCLHIYTCTFVHVHMYLNMWMCPFCEVNYCSGGGIMCVCVCMFH